MDTKDRSENNALLQQSDSWDGSWSTSVVEVQAPINGDWQLPIWIPGPILDSLPVIENHRNLTMRASSRFDEAAFDESIYLAEFVERRFVPEYVSTKRAAGRAHFQAILKHILTPERVVRAFGVNAEKVERQAQGNSRMAVYGFSSFERRKRGKYPASDRGRAKSWILDSNRYTHP